MTVVTTPPPAHLSVTSAPTSAAGQNSLDVTVVLPCYNEQDHVLQEIERITVAMDASGYSYELLVIDDKSTDNTLAVLEAALPRFPHMRLMPFRTNGGSGTARRIGTREAFGKIVVWTDADMTYPNERIPEFVRYLDDNPGVDQVVGARTTEEGTHKFLRVPAKWVIRKFAEKLSATKIPDLNSGLRAFRRDVSLPYLRLLPPASAVSRRSRCRSCPTSTRSTTCRSTTASGRARRSSTSSRTPTGTSCRSCAW
ncbi:glycosyltransferase family 2 protein [Blastococcus sp. PRF04-17]|uniref:glycosyltransferase family 2 protein n=1 Tax=Blastococcus sp. PRF04-17 TaxID=2933797 RepID=UPI001FF18B4B|nr:glycosyltransferase family 2 protein [Blastococcus sp. PRF04-17]UOY01231.1 glycosyltransferase family 2 protein [Blastococcus sp. PRF04-17]